MDKGNELYNNLKVNSIFKWFNYEIFHTGADPLNSNGPFKYYHCTFSKSTKSILIYTGLDKYFELLALVLIFMLELLYIKDLWWWNTKESLQDMT